MQIGHYFETPLHIACKDGDVERMNRLVMAGADLAAVDVAGMTPVMTGANASQFNAVKYLIERGADYQAKDCQGQSILFHAVTGENLELIDYLLGLGLDINAVDDTGCSVLLHTIMINPTIWSVRYLVQHGAVAGADCTDYITEFLQDFYSTHEPDNEYTELKNIKAHLQGTV